MFGLFKRKSSAGPVSLSDLGTDVHSHLIPGIDDGAKDAEDSVNIVRSMTELGITRFITTPHVMSDAYRNTPEIIRDGLETLRGAVAGAGLEVKIEAAAEYYLDEVFESQLDAGEDFLTFGGEKRYLLFETSYVSRPMSLETVVFSIQAKGFTPVLAHPERYNYFWGDKDISEIEHLVELGCKLQVNIGSFAGRYSKRAAMIATELAKKDMIDFLGSDIHRVQQTQSMVKGMSMSTELRKLLASDRLLNKQLELGAD